MNVKEKFLNILFPKNIKCISCGKDLFEESKYFLCKDCIKEIEFCKNACLKCGEQIKDESCYCLRCIKNVNKPYEKAFAPLVFNGKTIDLIHKLKYKNAQWIAPYLSQMLVDEFIKQNIKVDFVIPIPLNKKRLNERGYNQSEIICEKFISELKMQVKTNCLVRVRYTQTQTKLTSTERKENMKDAFKVDNVNEIKGKNILLVDDVYTTGSTLEEASKTLKRAKAGNIYCLTLAHVVI